MKGISAGKSAAVGLAAFSLLFFQAASCQAGQSASVPVRAESSVERTLLKTTTQSLYKLETTLSVYYDSATDEYIAEATACWQKKTSPFWAVAKSAEEFYEDSLIVTWENARGESDLIAQSNDFDGYYYGGKPIWGRDSEGAPYGHYVLTFREKTGYLGKELAQVKATVVLKKREGAQTDFAQVRMKYVHTYQRAVVGGSAGAKGSWAFLFPQAEETQWQIEDDVVFALI